MSSPVPYLLPDGPIVCCGGPASFDGASAGEVAGRCRVRFACAACGRREVVEVPVGPRVYQAGRCPSCGDAWSGSACRGCGLVADAAARLESFVREQAFPAVVASGLLSKGFYRTGLALLHLASVAFPQDMAVANLRVMVWRALGSHESRDP